MCRRVSAQAFAENLEIDDKDEDEDSGQQVGDVGEVLAVKRLLQRTHLYAYTYRYVYISIDREKGRGKVRQPRREEGREGERDRETSI